MAEFSKLPGIGKKTALRLVLHLLKQDVNDLVRRTDLEEETILDVIRILKEEFED